MDYRRQPNRPAEMTKPSSTFPTSQEQKAVPSSDGVTTAESEERSPPYASSVMRFLERIGISDPEVENYSSKDFYSVLLCNHLKTHTVQRGHVTCFTTVKPPITNFFGGLHGGVVAAIAERVAVATARTLVGEDKDIFLGELALSYLSSATINCKPNLCRKGLTMNTPSSHCHVESCKGLPQFVLLQLFRVKPLLFSTWLCNKSPLLPMFCSRMAELIVDGSVIRSGRNITLIAIEFKMRTTGELVYSCRATFYNSPIAKL
ncbi:hypothetical protein V6N11_077911 [Hibiscus sabdariffa]|uniref:Thioesterase domain-containing protein n=1 Tax=Hibiscus sabdariffa TaxID=183260 RepID=A0ABR2TF76_9ROSI